MAHSRLRIEDLDAGDNCFLMATAISTRRSLRLSLGKDPSTKFSICWSRPFSCSSGSLNQLTEPLRILFCGSDDLSVSCLDALHKESCRISSNIRSIEVVCRPAKRVGRGLKSLARRPLADVAQKLGLRLHEIDTFTGWRAPDGINLIVVVSFGLFVPPKILDSAQYGGINVHPSMLPEYAKQSHHTFAALADFYQVYAAQHQSIGLFFMGTNTRE